MLKQAIRSGETCQLGTNQQPLSVKWALISLSLCMLLSSLGTSIANVALPTLALAFSASFQQVQWVVIAYLLAITTLVVSIGRLGDILGRRRLLLAGIILFTMASLACGAAPSLWVLIAARTVQGLGAAAMMSLTLTFVSDLMPKEKTGSAMGLLGTMSAIGTALGPSLGGMLIATMNWRAIFFFNLVMGIAAFFLARRYLPTDQHERKPFAGQFDLMGTLLLALSLGAYGLAMTVGRGKFGALNLLCLALAAIGVFLFLRVEAKTAMPLIKPSVLRNRMLTDKLIANALVATVMMTTLVVGPFYLDRGLALTPALVGLSMSVGPLMSTLSGVPAGRITDRFGPQHITRAGLLLMAVGSILIATLASTWGVAGYIAPLVLTTIGYSLFQTANNTAVMINLPADQRGVISSMLSLARNFGLVTGASVMGAIFTFAAATTDISTAPSSAIAFGMRVSFFVAAALVVIALAMTMQPRADN